MEQGSARAAIGTIRFVDLLQTMGAGTDDRAPFRWWRRRNDLAYDRGPLVDDRRRRLLEMLLVVHGRDESKEQDQGHGEDPVDQAGDDRANADDPERGRDKIEENEDSDGHFPRSMEPLRPVHRRPIFRGMRVPEPLVRALLASGDRVASNQHEAEQDLRILRQVKGSEVN